MLPWLLVAAQQSEAGYFEGPADSGRAASVFNNGEQVDGDLWVRQGGGFDWIGDVGGTNFEDSWWIPEGSVGGDWWVSVSYVSGTNQIDPGSTSNLATWYKIAGSSSGSRKYDFRKTTSGSGGGNTQGVYDVEWSQDGGSTTHHTTTLTITLTEPTL